MKLFRLLFISVLVHTLLPLTNWSLGADEEKTVKTEPAFKTVAPDKPEKPFKPPTDTKKKEAEAKKPKTVVSASIKKAIDELTKDYQAYLKKPDDSKIRTECDYFGSTPPEDVTPEAIVTALERNAASDTRVDAYVKWQLLSGAPAVFDEKQSTRIGTVYLKAQQPVPRFGITQREQQQLDRALRSTRNADARDQLFQNIAGAIKQTQDANTSILSYRNELFQRLPRGYGRLMAGFQDAVARTNAVTADHEPFTLSVLSGVGDWLLTDDATPPRLMDMKRFLTKLYDVNGPTFCTGEFIEPNEQTSSYTLKLDSARLCDAGQIKEMIDQVDNKIRNPDSGLKFRDEHKPKSKK